MTRNHNEQLTQKSVTSRLNEMMAESLDNKYDSLRTAGASTVNCKWRKGREGGLGRRDGRRSEGCQIVFTLQLSEGVSETLHPIRCGVVSFWLGCWDVFLVALSHDILSWRAQPLNIHSLELTAHREIIFMILSNQSAEGMYCGTEKVKGGTNKRRGNRTFCYETSHARNNLLHHDNWLCSFFFCSFFLLLPQFRTWPLWQM